MKRQGHPGLGAYKGDEYLQKPLPPPIGTGKQVFRAVDVVNGRVQDWFATHDVHVYRFPAPGSSLTSRGDEHKRG